MRSILVGLPLLASWSAAAQETTIRVLGMYVTGQSLSSSQMTSNLQGIATAWNNSGLPAASITTVQLVNGAVAVSLSWPTLPGTFEATAEAALTLPAVVAARQQWQADIVIIFRNKPETQCGLVRVYWANGNFVPQSNGLDLRYRDAAYVAVVHPGCFFQVAAHEFGHLLGGGHATNTSSRLYDDARAHVSSYFSCNPGRNPMCATTTTGTALADVTDAPAGALFSTTFQYSRNATGYGDAGHNNVRTLALTARSAANFYQAPSNPVAILRPPVGVLGINYGCVSNGSTRH